MLEIGKSPNNILKHKVSHFCPDAGRLRDWDRFPIGQNDEGRVFDPRRDVEEGPKREGTRRRGEEEKWLRRTPMQVPSSYKKLIIADEMRGKVENSE